MTETLWRSAWGDAYHERNLSAFASSKRSHFWERFYRAYPVRSVLEIGCGAGANLRWACAERIYGMDVNAKAVAIAGPGHGRGEDSIQAR